MEESLDRLRIKQSIISQSPNIVSLVASGGGTKALQKSMVKSSLLTFGLFSLFTRRRSQQDMGTNQWTNTAPTGII
jgi:hypothetical protein